MTSILRLALLRGHFGLSEMCRRDPVPVPTAALSNGYVCRSALHAVVRAGSALLQRQRQEMSFLPLNCWRLSLDGRPATDTAVASLEPAGPATPRQMTAKNRCYAVRVVNPAHRASAGDRA